MQIKKFLVRVLCCTIPVAKWRRHLRAYLLNDASVKKQILKTYKAKFYGRRTCLLCDSKKLKFVGLNPDFQDCYVVRCKKCGFMFNVFEKISTDGYYEEEYRKNRAEHITQRYLDFQETRASAQFDFIRGNIKRPLENMTILEIGCSVARLLKKFESDTNKLVGYEADIEMASWAKDHIDGTIINSMCDVGKLSNNSYDLIMLSHVFEHLDDPIRSMKLLSDALKSNGYMFIEIPNENLKTVKYMCADKKGVGHYTYFSVRNFQALVKKFPDLELIKIETYTMNIDEYVSRKINHEPVEFIMDKKIEDNKGIHIRCLLKKRPSKNV